MLVGGRGCACVPVVGRVAVGQGGVRVGGGETLVNMWNPSVQFAFEMMRA